MNDRDLFWMPLLIVGVPVAVAWGYAVRQTVRASRRAERDGGSARWRRTGLAMLLGLLLLGGFLLVALGPLWFQATFSQSLIRRTEIRMLGAAEVVYGAAVVIAAMAFLPLLALLILGRRAAKTRYWAGRGVLLAVSVLLAAGVAEAASAACLWARTVPMPWLPTGFSDPPGENVVDILVIGESSARGVPYDDWLSMPDIVAWKLGEAFPQRIFQVENQAAPGLSLQAMHTKLGWITRRPELAILYAGHNEFQSRFDWAHGALHYADEVPPRAETLQSLARGVSPVLRLMDDTAESLKVSMPPTRTVTRQLVDVPVYTPEQYAERLKEFQTRLAAIVAYLEWIGAQVVLVIPPGNDAGFEPNRSFLPSHTSRAQREAFASVFRAARDDETHNPARAESVYRRLLEDHEGFAELHFRLARLLERTGRYDEAFDHYVAARDLDGLPMRLPSDFQQAYRDVAARHPRAILVDGPAELHARADHGIINDDFFADGFHPSLNGYTVLAQAILTELRRRQVFGWSAEASLPAVTPRECAEHFQMNAAKWAEVCGYSGWFYNRMAYVRHDPAERLAKGAMYGQAAQELKAGATTVESLHLPGVGPQAKSVSSRSDSGQSRR